MRLPFILSRTFKVAAITALLPLQGYSCGGWEVPKDHIDGVNSSGLVSYWDKIGDLDLGGGLSFPLVIGFESNREWSSPELGYGWVLPIFDSRLVQTAENSFELIAADGYTIQFGRDPKKPTLISGADWQGVISSGDTIKLWKSCGWQMTFTQGRLSSIGTPKGKTLLINRDATGVAREATYDGKVIVRVEKSFNGVVTGLQVGEKHLAIDQVERPRIQSIEGKNLVTGKSMSLGKVSSDGIAIKSYEYGVTDKLEPKLTATDQGKPPREITWDASSKIIKTDRDYTYSIIPPELPGFNASISRKNKAGQEEMWFKDIARGVKTVQKLDGVKKVTTWFTSGLAEGKIRRIEQTIDGKAVVLTRNAYDENGKFLRKFVRNISPLARSADPSKSPTSTEEKQSDSICYSYKYFDDNTTEITVTRADKLLRKDMLEKGRLVARTTFKVIEKSNVPVTDEIWTYRETQTYRDAFKNGSLQWREIDLSREPRISTAVRVFYAPDGKPRKAVDLKTSQKIIKERYTSLLSILTTITNEQS